MFTYDVVSESIRNPHELAAELTRRSEQGWEVVQVVYDGATWFHAIIRHEGRVGVAPFPGAGAPKNLDATAITTTPSPTVTAATVATEAASTPVSTAPPASGGESQPATAATETATTDSAATSTAASGDASVPEVPANWYKDPSGRFELRYWNGTAWTEHVATGGRQSVDPPKA